MTITDPAITTKHVLQALMSGQSPNGVAPEDCGEWAPIVIAAYTSHDSGGSEAVKRYVTGLLRSKDGKALASILARQEGKPTTTTRGAPALPSYATKIYEDAAPCGAWLDAYIDFASQAAPMTPRSFHEAAGLFAVSAVIARRIVLRMGIEEIFPNLFCLFIAPSTVYRKTTGLRVLRRLMSEANLRHMLIPERLTPEAFVQEMGLTIPPAIESADPDTYNRWLQERAFAAQRGWILDEAASLFDGMKRDFNAALLPLLLDLYECPEEKTEQTVGRGRVVVHDAYLSFFGVTTPSAIQEHIRNDALWSNGLWPRFALVTPDTDPSWQFFPAEMPLPVSLIRGLSRIASMWAAPTIEIVQDNEDKKRRYIQMLNKPEARSVGLAPGVVEAWEAYSKALGFDMLLAKDNTEGTAAPYGRLGTQAIKISMLLAAMDARDGAVWIERRHFARAQKIVEGWRASLHRLRTQTATTEEAHTSDRMLAMLAESGTAGIKARDIYRPLGIGAAEANTLLHELSKAGLVEMIETKNASGRRVEVWRLADISS